MRTVTTRAAALVLVGLAALSACSKKAPETAPAPANADSVARAHTADSVAAAQATATAHRDAVAKVHSDSVAKAGAALAAAKTAVHTDMVSTVYFDFDKSALTDSAKKRLDRKIAILTANPSVGVQIEGHTDERGSTEYNLALGQQRAAAVKRYLTQHGIAESRIAIISKGEEVPAAPGHDETSWSLNRRAEFVIAVGELSASP